MAKKPKKILHGMLGSTEPAARQVVQANRPKRAKPTKQKDTGGRRTAPDTHKRLTKEQQAKSLAAARKRAANRPTVKKKAQKKPKRKSYGRDMS